jgi:predicted lipoprotein
MANRLPASEAAHWRRAWIRSHPERLTALEALYDARGLLRHLPQGEERLVARVRVELARRALRRVEAGLRGRWGG